MPAQYEVDVTEMVAPKLQAAWKRGLAEGLHEGLRKGKEEGLHEGIEKGKLEAARGMLDAGAEIGFVIKATGLTRAELKQAGLVQKTELGVFRALYQFFFFHTLTACVA